MPDGGTILTSCPLGEPHWADLLISVATGPGVTAAGNAGTAPSGAGSCSGAGSRCDLERPGSPSPPSECWAAAIPHDSTATAHAVLIIRTNSFVGMLLPQFRFT